MTKTIGPFEGEALFLSNFWMQPFEIEGISFKSVEHAFQAAKSTTQLDFNNIRSMSTPGLAKGAGRRIQLREDWEDIKHHVMRAAVTAKFLDKDLRYLLLLTGDAQLVELNHWNDTYWGVNQDTMKGENHLGKILMEVRAEIYKEVTSS